MIGDPFSGWNERGILFPLMVNTSGLRCRGLYWASSPAIIRLSRESYSLTVMKYSLSAGSYPSGSIRRMPYIPMSMWRWVW
jgi:hypothetical protein